MSTEPVYSELAAVRAAATVTCIGQRLSPERGVRKLHNEKKGRLGVCPGRRSLAWGRWRRATKNRGVLCGLGGHVWLSQVDPGWKGAPELEAQWSDFPSWLRQDWESEFYCHIWFGVVCLYTQSLSGK